MDIRLILYWLGGLAAAGLYWLWCYMEALAIIAIVLAIGAVIYTQHVQRKQREWYKSRVFPVLAATRQSVRDWESEHKEALRVAARLAETNAELSLRLLEAVQHAPQPSSSVLPLYNDTPTDFSIERLDIRSTGN